MEIITLIICSLLLFWKLWDCGSSPRHTLDDIHCMLTCMDIDLKAAMRNREKMLEIEIEHKRISDRILKKVNKKGWFGI